jgi:hypothetical protein
VNRTLCVSIAEAIAAGCAARGGGYGREAWRTAQFHAFCCERHFYPHTIRDRCHCVKNLYATISAAMLAKISTGINFRNFGVIEWRAADRLG